MVLPHFTYGDIIYAATNDGNLKKLQRIQNRGLRVCVKPEDRISIDNLHRATGVNLLEDIRDSSMLAFSYKRTQVRKYVDARDIRTRAHDFVVLKVENTIKTRYEKSVQYRCYKRWSDASRDIKATPTYTLLKTKLKKSLKNKLN